MKKRIISVLLCFAMLSSLFLSNTAAAAEAEWNYTSPAMKDYDVTYYSASTASSVSRGGNSLSFSSVLSSSERVKLYVSFPKEGGIRIYSANEGFFTPSGVYKITYEKLSDKVYSLTPDGGSVTAVFDYSSTPWKITAVNTESENAFTVYGDKILFGYDTSDTLKKVRLEGDLSSGEVIYGLGERYNGFNLVGKTVPLWNTDTGYHTWTEKSGDKAYSYVNVPFMHSSLGYSLFFNSSYGGTADIGDTSSDSYSLEFCGEDFDFYTYLGTPLENIENYTALTGRPSASPKWSFGYWAGKTASGWTGSGTMSENVADVLEKYKKMGTLPTAVYLESLPFDEASLAVAEGYGVKGLCWNNPSQALLLSDGMTDTAFSKNNLKILLPGISESVLPKSFDDCWGDFSNSLMLTALKNGGYTKLLNAGLAGAMVDYGEYIGTYGSFSNGMTGEEMHNFYPYYYNKAVSEVFSGERGDDYILFARAGCAGSQKYAASFAGDQNSSFDGLKSALSAGLSISASGFSTWGSDIGGHYSSKSEIGDELYQRWLEFSLFSPLMRLHGNTEKDPWNFSAQAQNTFKNAYALRNNIIDLLYSANISANTDGTPMMQAMAMAFPEEAELAAIEDQYLFCNELLVCPVVTEGATSRTVNLPSGSWISLWDNSLYEGGSCTVEAQVDEIPVFIREGAVIPVTLSENYSLFEQPESDGIAAFLITAGENKRTVKYNAQDGTVYTFESGCENGEYTLSCDGSVDRCTLILAGVDAVEVTADGCKLERLSSLSDGSYGFYTDTVNNRTVVKLASSWKNLTYSEGEVYKNDFSDTRVSSSTADFGIYFADGNSTEFSQETAEEHLSSANGVLARVTDPNGYSDRDIDRNIVSAVYLNAKYTDFTLEATIKGTAGGASSLGFVIGQKTPGKHYMSSDEGGYAVFFKRFGTSVNLAVAYNGKSVDADGKLTAFDRSLFVGTLDNFEQVFGVSTASPLRVRLEVAQGNLQAYVYNDVTEKYVKLGETVPLLSYDGGYIALAQSTAQVTSGASNDQYFDNLRIRSDSPEYIKRSPSSVITAEEYKNSFDFSSASMLENDFDVYYAENQLKNTSYVKQSISDYAERLHIENGWLSRKYQGGNNWQPYLNNVILCYRHRIFGDVTVDVTNRFLNGGNAKSTFMTVQLGQQTESTSAYADTNDGGYLVTLQLCGGSWSIVTVVHRGNILYKVALGNEASISSREGFDRYVVMSDYNTLVSGTLGVEVKDKMLTVKRNGTEVITDLLLEDYEPGYASVGFDIGNPDSGTGIDELRLYGAALPVEFESLGGAYASLKSYYGYEYSTDGVSFGNVTDFSGLSHNTEYTFYQRIAAGEAFAAGEAVSRKITVKYLPGDFNGNNLYQSDDLSQLRRVLLGSDSADSEISDVNGDKSVDIIDLVKLKKLCAS